MSPNYTKCSTLLSSATTPFLWTKWYFSTTCISCCHSSIRPKHPNDLKGRKPAEQRWLVRQFKDPYVIKSKLANYRARSAFKLIEMDDRFRILQAGARVVDCGAAPGAWTQVSVERVNALGEHTKRPVGKVVAVDKVFMTPVDGAIVFHSSDFTKPEIQKTIEDQFSDDNRNQVDVVLSDMAPSRTGNPECDHERIIGLCYEALLFAIRHLAIGGNFLTKLWDGAMRTRLSTDMEKHFERVSHIKPDASRDDSSEMFLLATGFKGIKQTKQ